MQTLMDKAEDISEFGAVLNGKLLCFIHTQS